MVDYLNSGFDLTQAPCHSKGRAYSAYDSTLCDDFSRALGDNTNTGAAAAGEGNEIVGRSSDAAAGWKRLEGRRRERRRNCRVAAFLFAS